jgi:hypothetical protein
VTDCPRCELADAIRASRTTGLAYALTADGFRPLAHDVDPFAGAPMADYDYQHARRRTPARYKPAGLIQPCGTHAAFNRHKKRGEPIDDNCRQAEREYQSAKARRFRARGVDESVDILTTPSGAPMLVSVARQGDSAPSETADRGPSSEAGNCRPEREGLAS